MSIIKDLLAVRAVAEAHFFLLEEEDALLQEWMSSRYYLARPSLNIWPFLQRGEVHCGRLKYLLHPTVTLISGGNEDENMDITNSIRIGMGLVPEEDDGAQDLFIEAQKAGGCWGTQPTKYSLWEAWIHGDSLIHLRSEVFTVLDRAIEYERSRER